MNCSNLGCNKNDSGQCTVDVCVLNEGIKRYNTDELLSEYMYNNSMETACKSEDVDKLIADHKAVVETIQKKLLDSQMANGELVKKDDDNSIIISDLKNKIKELEKINELMKCCGNCGYFCELGKNYLPPVRCMGFDQWRAKGIK